MVLYKHTQIGYLILAVLIGLGLFYAWLFGTISAQVSSNVGIVLIMVLILVILASFLTLTVLIDEQYLRIRFGYGIFSKKFLLSNIVSANAVKNHWYYGWGIRLWLWPYMWIFNVSGFNAVQISMKNGKIYRIGTNVPGELETAIKKALLPH